MPSGIQTGRIKAVTYVSHPVMVYEQYWKTRKANRNVNVTDKYDRWRGVGKVLMLSKEALCRLEWIIFYNTKANKNSTLVCRHFGISRSVFYKWLGCFKEFNLRSLETKSRKPNSARTRAAVPLKDGRVIALRKQYPYFGKKKIAVLYRRQYQEDITDWYVQRVIEQFHLYFKKKKKH